MVAVETNVNKIALLKEDPLLSGLSANFVHALADKCEVSSFPADTYLILKNTSWMSYFVIISGSIYLEMETDNNRKLTIDTIRNGARLNPELFYDQIKADFSYKFAKPTKMLVLSKRDIENIKEDFPDDYDKIISVGKIKPVIDFISKIPLFSSLTSDRIQHIATKLEKKVFEKGEVIMREGEVGLHLFVMVSGSVKIYKDSMPDTVLATLYGGNILGEIALVSDKPRNASAMALDKTAVYILNRDDFLNLLKEQESLFKSIKLLVDKRKSDTKKQIHDIKRKSWKSKVTRTVFKFKKDVGDKVDIAESAVAPQSKFKKFPNIRQQSQMDCGPTCLTIVCSYYGKRVGLNSIREILRVDRSGTTMAGLIRGAKELGFNVVACKSIWNQLLGSQMPAIVNWDGYHWVVVFKVYNDKIIVSDPAQGLVTYSKAKFEKHWARFTIFLSPNEKFKELETYRRSFARFTPYLKNLKKALLAVSVATLAERFFGIFLPLLTMFIVDEVLVKTDTRFFVSAFTISIAFILLQYVTSNLNSIISLYIGKKVSLSILKDFYKHLLCLPLSYFEDRHVGDVTTRFQENNKILNFLTTTGISMFLDIIIAMMVSIIFLFISPLLTGLLILFSVLDIIVVFMISPLMQRGFRETFNKMASLQSHFIQTVKGMKAIKTLGISHLERWKFENKLIELENSQLKLEMLGNYTDSAKDFFDALTTVALIGVGAYLVFNGSMTIGELIAFQALSIYVREPLSNLINSWDEFQESLNAVERVNDIYDSAPEIDEAQRQDLVELPTLQGEIEFSNLTFRYNEDAQDNILQNLSFSINAGQKVAFVGRSGSGKSTIIKLIYGFYTQNSGHLYFDRFETNDTWIPSLRKQIGVVLQEDFLFEGTIHENIGRGHSGAKFGEIVEASKMAAAHDFITSLPDGYETKVKSDGKNFSGGERQRICLARTLLQNPQILIMDEATSALDNESERFVMGNIYEQFKNRTVIMIAHRLSTVQKCDRIFVLDKGNIIESGNHEDLLAEQGLYYMLHVKQST